MPSLVFLAARVNNDTLANCVNFLAFALLVVWWQRGGWRWWLAALVVIGVGLLTKSTALLLLAVAMVAALLRPMTPWKLKAQWAGAGLLIVGLLAGWLAVRRMREGQRQLVANLATSSPAMKLTDNRADFVTFNPARVAAEPYNYGLFRMPDRDHFWEYWFRSALFGQFTFPQAPRWLAQTMAVTGMATVVAALFSLALGLRHWRESLPFVLLLVVSVAGHIAYVVSAPFAASHDFRYSLMVLLPAAWALGRSQRLAFVAIPFVLLTMVFLIWVSCC